MRILIWGEIRKGNAYDVFRQLDYKTIYDELKTYCGGNYVNIGNKVWIQGIISTLDSKDNELFFYNGEESWEIINSKYDKIVYSAANMLNSAYADLIERVAKMFRKCKIPVYVIAIGAQAGSYDELTGLVKATSGCTADFLDSIYQTGGEIACRGFFTKEYLDKIATNSAVVTGCPSLFQAGRDLRIEKKDDGLKPVFNGNAPFEKLASVYADSVYIDQGDYLGYFYDMTQYNELRYLADMVSVLGETGVRLLLQGRIKCFWDIADWKRYIGNGGFNFSIRPTIHGNILSLLSGIPAVVFAADSRTREMAEFFNIPMTSSMDDYEKTDEVFHKTDYSEFNKNYSKLFDDYEKFLRKCGLVNKIDRDNTFWERELPLNRNAVDDKLKRLNERYSGLTVIEKAYVKLAKRVPSIARIKEIETVPIREQYIHEA